jgi:hypothetical protein
VFNFILAAKSYVSVKTFFESRVSLAIPPINATVKLTVHSLMSRVKKILLASLAFFSLESLSPGFFNDGAFSWTTQHVPPLLKAASRANASAVKLDSPAKTNGRFVLERDGELTPHSGGFLAAIEKAGVSLRNFIVVPLFFRITLAPKVSRYIFKSVLNI